MMPKMDGLALLRELRTRDAFAEVPVVVASCVAAEDAPHDVPRLAKPLSRQPVLDAIDRYLVARRDRAPV
jgi:CheY-like chemotaxis protein